MPDDLVDDVAEVAMAAQASGLLFTEQMKGFVALGVDDPQTGHDRGKQNKDRLMFELTISVDDVDRFVAEPGHQGSATGYVDSDLLGGRLDVERGWFNLFVQDDDPDQRQMLYRLWLRGPGGNPMTFIGRQGGPRRGRSRRVARHLDALRQDPRRPPRAASHGSDDG